MRGSLHLLVREKGSVVLLIWRRQTCRSRYLSPVFAFPANLYVAVIPDYHRHCNAVVKRFLPPFRILVHPPLFELNSSLLERAPRLITGGTISERVNNHRGPDNSSMRPFAEARSDLDLLPASLPESEPHEHGSRVDVEDCGHPRSRHPQPEGNGQDVGGDQAHDPRRSCHDQEYCPRIPCAAQPTAEAEAHRQRWHGEGEHEQQLPANVHNFSRILPSNEDVRYLAAEDHQHRAQRDHERKRIAHRDIRRSLRQVRTMRPKALAHQRGRRHTKSKADVEGEALDRQRDAMRRQRRCAESRDYARIRHESNVELHLLHARGHAYV